MKTLRSTGLLGTHKKSVEPCILARSHSQGPCYDDALETLEYIHQDFSRWFDAEVTNSFTTAH